jgi:hypothetical protein
MKTINPEVFAFALRHVGSKAAAPSAGVDMLKRLNVSSIVMEVDLKALANFLVSAKIKTYAGGGLEESDPQRPGFKELVYAEGPWEYRDSYVGFYLAPGQEVVRLGGEPVWVMSYSGGMAARCHGDLAFAKQTFDFLRKALLRVDASMPYRGPKSLKFGEFKYVNEVKGSISDFAGKEKILRLNREVFAQNYCGGLVVNK